MGFSGGTVKNWWRLDDLALQMLLWNPSNAQGNKRHQCLRTPMSDFQQQEHRLEQLQYNRKSGCLNVLGGALCSERGILVFLVPSTSARRRIR